MSIVTPAGYDSLWQGEAARSARLRVPAVLIQEAAHEIGERCQTSVEIKNVFRTNDPEIEHLTTLLLGEIARASHLRNR